MKQVGVCGAGCLGAQREQHSDTPGCHPEERRPLRPPETEGQAGKGHGAGDQRDELSDS